MPACVAFGIPFKVARNERVHQYLNSKQCARGSAGKFITIYPPSREVFVDVIDQIRIANSGATGPYILSDRRYGDGTNVFYRYGGFLRRQRVNIDGTHTPVITAPDGSEIADDRLPFFRLPPGIDDPFPSAAVPPAVVTLAGRFTVDRVLSFTNSGGVYAATDSTTGASVVVKEARPLTNHLIRRNTSWDAVDILKHEFAILNYLKDTGAAPRPIASFDEWEHAFIAESFVEGMPFHSCRNIGGLSFLDALESPDLARRFYQRFMALATSCMTALSAVHAAGVIIGDISPNNTIVNPVTNSVTFIDFESSKLVGESGQAEFYAQRVFTPGFRTTIATPTGTTSTVNDIEALGLLLFSLILPVQPLFAFRPAAREDLLEELTRHGMEAWVSDIIRTLLGGEILPTSHLACITSNRYGG